MQIKRVVADIRIEWRADDGKNAGTLSFGVETDSACSLEGLPAALAAALAIPVASMVPPKPAPVPVAPKPAPMPSPEVVLKPLVEASLEPKSAPFIKRKPRA